MCSSSALNSDRSVRANKGPDAADHAGGRARGSARRARVRRCGRRSSTKTRRTTLIAAIQPDVLVKGADWAADAIVGRDIVEARGGRVVRVPVEPGYSTTCDHRQDSQRRPLTPARWRLRPDRLIYTGSFESPSSIPVATSDLAQPSCAAEDRRHPQRDGSPGARRVAGLTPAGEGAVRRRRPLRRCRTASSCTSCRPTATSRRRSPTSRFFLAGARRAFGCGGRPRGPAVSVARNRSVSRAGAALRRHIRARASASCARHRHGARRRRVGGRADAARERARRGSMSPSLDLKPGQEIAPTDLAELLVDAGFTPRRSGRRARRVRRPRRHRRHLSRRRSAAGAPRIHRRHDRVAAHVRPRDAAIHRAARSAIDS